MYEEAGTAVGNTPHEQNIIVHVTIIYEYFNDCYVVENAVHFYLFKVVI